MASPQQGLKGLAGAVGIFFGALLLSMLVGAATAIAQNTAFGTGALASNTTGFANSAFGFEALFGNTTGSDNTASGAAALLDNTLGSDNTASGVSALRNNTTGFFNIGLGFYAGFNIVAGSNNIDIGGYGFTDESNTIRIGNQGGPQKKTFIAGISGTPVVGADVTVNGNGQLGVLPSSARYKRDIHDMGRRERRSDEAATSHFPLQERPQRHIAVWLGGRGG